MPVLSRRRIVALVAAFAVSAAMATVIVRSASSLLDADTGLAERVIRRMAIADGPTPRSAGRLMAMTPAERRAAVDAAWGPGLPTATKLEIFDKFWSYADEKFAAFQGIDVDWVALRDKYRPEVAAGVSRGRFAGIINRMALELRDGHTIPLDLVVNVFTLPQPGVPLLGVGGWTGDTSGACLTAQDDGSSLIYSARPNHPMSLVAGDRILGYDGIPWRDLYPQLIDEELPMWPLWWGSGPEGYEHSWVMSAGLNWHLFDTMDVHKQATNTVVHLPTNLMPGPIFGDFCSEQMAVPGVSKPTFFGNDFVRAGVVDGTNIGYIYVWGWLDPAADEFAAAVEQLTNVDEVDGLIIDFRFNVGGFLRAPFTGLSMLFDHPAATIGEDTRMRPDDHFKMKAIGLPSEFKVDFDRSGRRNKSAFAGPVAVLTGPGAISAGDFSSLWASYLPRARTFGKTSAMAIGLPTQPALGTELFLHPDWDARVAETNTYRVGAPHDYLIHTDLPVDERVWLRPADVANGTDSVVQAALAWLGQQVAARPRR